MRSMKKMLGQSVTVAMLTFAGCAPAASTWHAGPGIQVGLSPSGKMSLSNSQCSLMATPGVEGSPLARNTSAASTVMARMQQVARIQWSFLLADLPMAARMDTWKAIASGGC